MCLLGVSFPQGFVLLSEESEATRPLKILRAFSEYWGAKEELRSPHPAYTNFPAKRRARTRARSVSSERVSAVGLNYGRLGSEVK